MGMKKENRIDASEILCIATMYNFLNKDVVKKDIENIKGSNNLSIDTIAYCLTAIICAIILAFSIYQIGRYSTTMDGRSVIDKYKNVNKNVEYNWKRR